MDAPEGHCAFCGAPADHQHHLTGRHPDRSYLHPHLTVGLCHRHHCLVHDDLRAQRIDTPTHAAAEPAGAAVFALRRIAVFLGRFAKHADNPLWQSLAGVLQELADTVQRALQPEGRTA